ncbi:MAG: polymerase sigma-70 factor, subfamily [Frankiales bacterium]|jgi:RNA polymerase sigma-70 factor (ECF subfamily)|nr:polymerase sigma-70 factor, subfamily [Frankiales bacterium]MDX6214344.1 polymerase sigma-70 factor, subfamily [Frankiales bacterium]MDX6221091.1 polymerase sigma-70 factor, subfamily [Frankiales bacterium]
MGRLRPYRGTRGGGDGVDGQVAEHADALDRALLDRHVGGDSAAFSELVRRHQDRLWAVAIRTLGDREEAADAVQDALLSAYRAAGSYRGEAKVSTWLHRIVVNACLDRARRQQSRPTVPLPDDDRHLAAGDALANRELATDLGRALAELPMEQRMAIVLVDAQGYPVDEVARLLSVPVGTVKSRCSRGRARLATLLRDPQSGADGNPGRHRAVQPQDAPTQEQGGEQT